MTDADHTEDVQALLGLTPLTVGGAGSPDARWVGKSPVRNDPQNVSAVRRN